jgi:hypothetical protein
MQAAFFNYNKMKRLTIIGIIFFMATSTYAQKCQVLGPSGIIGEYEGDCKRGVAHGEGVATGKAKYIGEFKKGYPEGEGTYFYANGDVLFGEWEEGKVMGYGYKIEKADTLSGYWKGDPDNVRFMGTEKDDLKGYTILAKDNISNVIIEKADEGADNQLTLKLSDINRSIYAVSFREISSGQQQEPQYVNPGRRIDDAGRPINDYGRIILQLKDVVYPFTGTIRYQVLNKSANFALPVVLKFQIKEPGNWTVSINHR